MKGTNNLFAKLDIFVNQVDGKVKNGKYRYMNNERVYQQRYQKF
ncbi:MAG: hypothetical protein ABIK90_01675 [candidate division WOR-3 bacterium]